MKIITTHEAKTHLSRYLARVEQGEQFTIARGSQVIALLSPIHKADAEKRPKVGEIEGEPFEFPPEAFVPLDSAELNDWGL